MGSSPIQVAIFWLSKSYASVAQSVEQRTENPRVTGSIPVLGTLCASGSVVEHRLAKARVASSNLVSRFLFRILQLSYDGLSPSGKAQDFDSCIRWFESS